MNYSYRARERIRLDHELLRATSNGAIGLVSVKSDREVDLNCYVINFVNDTLDTAFENQADSEPRHITRDNITRKNGMKDKDDFAISFLIDYIDQFCDEDYRDIVDGYIAHGTARSFFEPSEEEETSDGSIADGAGASSSPLLTNKDDPTSFVRRQPIRQAPVTRQKTLARPLRFHCGLLTLCETGCCSFRRFRLAYCQSISPLLLSTLFSRLR